LFGSNPPCNGADDADGAQARRAERVSAAQSVQVVGHSDDSMDSGGIAGTGVQLGAAEDVGASLFEVESEAAQSNGIPRPSNWQERSRNVRRNWSRRYIWNGKYEGGE